MEEKELLQQILESNKKTESYTKRQFIVNTIRSVASVAMLIVVVVFVIVTSAQVATLVSQANTTLESIDSAMKSADEVAKELNSVDLVGTIGSMNEFLSDAAEKVNALDVEGLNAAISDLQATVAPLAKLFGKK